MEEMCCVVKMNVKKERTKDSLWHVLYRRICFLMRHMAAPAGVLMFVAVISGFILSSLPFVSQFYWIVSLLPLYPMFISAISCYCCLEICLVLSRVRTRTDTHGHDR